MEEANERMWGEEDLEIAVSPCLVFALCHCQVQAYLLVRPTRKRQTSLSVEREATDHIMSQDRG